MIRLLARLLCFIALIAQSQVYAQDITTGIVEFSVGTGYSHYDSKRDIQNGLTGSMGLGMHFGHSYAAVVNYAKSYAEQKYTSDAEVKIRRFHVDGYRFFSVDNAFRPFIVLGFGNTDITEDNQEKYDETQLNAGLGAHYQMNANWAVRADVRNFYSIDAETNDQTFMMSLVYRFAEGETAP